MTVGEVGREADVGTASDSGGMANIGRVSYISRPFDIVSIGY